MKDLALRNAAASRTTGFINQVVCKTLVQCLQVNSLDPEHPIPMAATLVMIPVLALVVMILVMVLVVMIAGPADASTLKMVMTGGRLHCLLTCSRVSQSIMSWAHAHWTLLVLIHRLHGLASSLLPPPPLTWGRSWQLASNSPSCSQAIMAKTYRNKIHMKSCIPSPGHSCAVQLAQCAFSCLNASSLQRVLRPAGVSRQVLC